MNTTQIDTLEHRSKANTVGIHLKEYKRTCPNSSHRLHTCETLNSANLNHFPDQKKNRVFLISHVKTLVLTEWSAAQLLTVSLAAIVVCKASQAVTEVKGPEEWTRINRVR